jgi:hypothetical protein
MTERPWEHEPDSLDFEADGLPCIMRRNPRWGTWCGYVGIGREHPLFGLPTNHPLKLPSSWFEGRSAKQGFGYVDLVMHALSGAKSMEEACPISLAFEVHGGVNYANDHVPGRESDGRWWFGFDCGHADDYAPGAANVKKIMGEMIDSMPKEARGFMRDIVFRTEGVYRDQQYVVSECQSLASQLIAIATVIERMSTNASSHDRRD